MRRGLAGVLPGVLPGILAAAVLVLGMAGCAGGAGTASGPGVGAGGGGGTAAAGDVRIVVTTNILGDVVTQLVGDQVGVRTLMAPNADPHSFGVSARDAQQMQEADLVVANGLGLEDGLLDHVEAARSAGTAVFEAGDHLTPLEYDTEDASGIDPHFWTDPQVMAQVVTALEGEIAAHVEGVDAALLHQATSDYLGELDALDQDMSTRFAAIPAAHRALVTNHHVFGYLAARYDFRVIGAVIPGGATLAAPSASDLADLADAVREAGVPAIFADSSQPDQLVRALAEHTGVEVAVVPLFTESLTEPEGQAPTYLDMMRVNTDRIEEALTAS